MVLYIHVMRSVNYVSSISMSLLKCLTLNVGEYIVMQIKKRIPKRKRNIFSLNQDRGDYRIKV